MPENIPAYILQNGQFVYNPNNTGGVENFKKLPVNPGYSPVSQPQGVIIGTSPTTKEILVSQGADKSAIWQPASSPEQMAEATKAIQDINAFDDTHVKISATQFMPISEYDKLDQQDKELLRIKGPEALQARQDIAKAQFESRNQKLPGDTWINKIQLQNIDEKYRNVALDQGFEAMTRQMKADEDAQNKARADAILTLQPYYQGRDKGGGYRLAEAIKSGVDEQTLKTAGFQDDAIQRAKFDAKQTRDVSISPVPEGQESKPLNWAQEQAGKLQHWQTQFAKPTDKKSLLKTAGEGAIYALLTTATALPLLALSVAGDPTHTHRTLYDTGKGLVNHVKSNARNLVTGAYIPDLKAGNAFSLVSDTAITALIVTPVAKGVGSALAKGVTYIHPRGIPPSIIAKEASTGRIPVSDTMVAKDWADAINIVERQAATKGGDFTANVPIKGTPYELRYLKTPVQQVIGNVLFHGTKTEGRKASLLDVAKQSGKIKAKEDGLYTSPYAAMSYTRGGTNPALIMVVTDVSKMKSGAAGLKAGMTDSDAFIKGADEGFYGSSKGWRKDMETEIVYAPGSKLTVPPPTAGLTTRLFSGSYADFFTRDSGQYVPVKIAVDTVSMGKNAANINARDFYAAKLLILKNALRDTTEALKHPGLVLKDISGTLKEMANLEKMLDSEGGAKGGSIAGPGVRDVYVITNWGTKIKMLADSLHKTAVSAAAKGDKYNTGAIERAYELALKEAYVENARQILRQYDTAARAYNASTHAQEAFEASYLANTGLAIESIVKTNRIQEDAMETAIEDVQKQYPETRIPERRKVTDSVTRREPVVEKRSAVSSSEYPEEYPERYPGEEYPERYPGEEYPERPPPEERRPPEEEEYPPEEIEYPEKEYPPDEPTIRIINIDGVSKELSADDLKSAVAWRQGIGWWLILKPYNQRQRAFFVKKVPDGVNKISTGRGSPQKTIQPVVGAGPGRDYAYDLGRTDIHLKAKPLSLKFKPDKRQRTRGDMNLANPKNNKYHMTIPHPVRRGAGVTRRSNR